MVNLKKPTMVNLIKRYILGTRTGFSWVGNEPTNPSYTEVRDQVISFLTDRHAAHNHRPWLRALIAVLSQGAKINLVDDLLTEVEDNPGKIDKTLLIDVAMEIIYPPSTLHRVKTEVKAEKEEGNYPYISFSHAQFAKVMAHWSKEISGDINFFDVGCGLGDKLILARWFVDRVNSVTGVELNTHVYNLGQFFIGNLYNTRSWSNVNHPWNTFRILIERPDGIGAPTQLTMIEDDAFNIDYHPYNLIYMYQPIANHCKMIKLYQHILETMPVGGLMVEVLSSCYQEITDWVETLCERKDLSVLEQNYRLVVKKIA